MLWAAIGLVIGITSGFVLWLNAYHQRHLRKAILGFANKYQLTPIDGVTILGDIQVLLRGERSGRMFRVLLHQSITAGATWSGVDVALQVRTELRARVSRGKAATRFIQEPGDKSDRLELGNGWQLSTNQSAVFQALAIAEEIAPCPSFEGLTATGSFDLKGGELCFVRTGSFAEETVSRDLEAVMPALDELAGLIERSSASLGAEPIKNYSYDSVV